MYVTNEKDFERPSPTMRLKAKLIQGMALIGRVGYNVPPNTL